MILYCAFELFVEDTFFKCCIFLIKCSLTGSEKFLSFCCLGDRPLSEVNSVLSAIITLCVCETLNITPEYQEGLTPPSRKMVSSLCPFLNLNHKAPGSLTCLGPESG